LHIRSEIHLLVRKLEDMYISLAGGGNFLGRKGSGEMTVDTVTAGNFECEIDVYTYRCLPYAISYP
jgi:hypothetical protein